MNRKRWENMELECECYGVERKFVFFFLGQVSGGVSFFLFLIFWFSLM